jgi:N-acetylglucosamine-6-phosphate deacetylase
MILRSSVYYSDGNRYENKDIVIEEGRIAAIGNWREPDIDLSGLLVLPGFIDIHVHGGGGSDVMDASYEAINNISLHKLREGVTSFCPTTITARPSRTYAAIDAINGAISRGGGGARILGAFLEGPYINPRYKGAHPEEYIRDISLDEIEDLLERGQGNIISVAIAPELPNALEAIKMLRGRGINVRLGHSGASYEETIAGIAAGGSIAIHTFNAMSPFSHRAPGMIGAVMENDDVINELICDFIHTRPAAARLLYKAKGADRIALITDCVSAGGMPDGSYQLGELRITVTDGTARTDTDAIAGSTLNLLKAVKNMSQTLRAPLAEAVKMATAVPATALGVFDRVGDIAAGKYADIIAVDESLNLCFVMVGGRVMPFSDK